MGKNKFYLKIHGDEKKIVAICDEELIGKTFVSDFAVLDLKDYAEFFKGKLMDKEEVLKNLLEFDSLNCVGNRIVDLLIKEKLINKDSVLIIGGIKHAQVYKIGCKYESDNYY